MAHGPRLCRGPHPLYVWGISWTRYRDRYRRCLLYTSTGCTNATELQRMLARRDSRRHNYYTHYTGKKWGDSHNYHLSLDSLSLIHI